MATEKRLIDANALLSKFKEHRNLYAPSWEAFKVSSINVKSRVDEIDTCMADVINAPTVDAVEVPCKIGDFVWAIRNFHGHKHPQRGIVSDMFFTKNMKLMIVVKYVARGEWGETVFATDKEAYAAIGVPCCPNCGAKMDLEEQG